MMNEADYSRKWYVMIAVASGVFLATIDGSIVNIALPTLVDELGTDFAFVQWVVLAYLLTVTTLMLSIGRLADMIGKKSIYTTGFIIFTIGSALCGLAPSIYPLIGFRVIQAIGAAFMMALGTAIVTEAFPASERGKALGIMGSMVSIGIIAGPALGGLILSSLSWHWIFFVNLPIGIAGVILVIRHVPASKPQRGQSFDFLGAITLFACMTCFLAALTTGQQWGFTQPLVLSLFAGWVVSLISFIKIENNQQQPMIDLKLFRNRLFAINVATGFLCFVSSAGTVLLMPFYLENVLQYNPASVGLLLGFLPLMIGIVAPVAGSLSDRFGPRPIIVAGLILALIGYFAVSTLQVDTTAVGYILRFLFVGLGMGIFQSPNNSAIMGSAPKSSFGVASGLLAVTRTLGQTTGTALLGAVWASRILSYDPGIPADNVMQAPPAIQVMALRDTQLLVVGIVAVCVLLSVFGFVNERIIKRTQASDGAIQDSGGV